MIKTTSYDYNDLLKSANGELFDKGAGRLPLPNMLMMDRINHISTEGGKYDKGQVIAELDIKPDLWFFGCHFKDDPVMPGTLGLDALFQLTGFFLTFLGHKGKGRALGCEKIKFNDQILPENKVVKYIVDIKRIINLKLTMIIADGVLQVDGKDAYFTENMKVGLFA
jgi:3-hydroxyacyl-[acyl-carrier protein] dehydratase/trans-2-decenoyl-[acyl-carrier protein] isomerase